MVLVITQKTYDDAVRENMEEFEMTLEEAVEETVQQFEAQGIDLSGIVTDLMSSAPTSSPAITEAVTTLSNLVKARTSVEPDRYIRELAIIKSECDKGLAYRVLAGKEGAYCVLLDTMLKLESNKEVVSQCLETLISLMTKQPDLLEEKGVQTIVAYLDKERDFEIIKLVLKWTKECCVLHEKNRQHLVEAGILNHVKPLVHEANAEILREVLAVLRALVLDDDVRVEFGRSHEHARIIASDTLCAITGLLDKFKKDESVMNDIMLTLSALLVRTEFCKKLQDAGGLKIIHEAMVEFHESEKIIKQCLKVLKGLAGNDECKAQIIQRGTGHVIVSSMNRHKNSVNAAINGLGCVAALTLRSPENSKVLFEAGIAEVIVDIMKQFSDNENVQKNASWAIRNLVSRSRYQNKRFLELGVESILKNNLKKFMNSEYDTKAALRDLGCDVELKEAWTGKGGRLHTQGKK